MIDYRARADYFKRTVLWLEDRGGEAAVMRAFADPEPLEAIWQLALPEFREALRKRAREALVAERGAA